MISCKTFFFSAIVVLTSVFAVPDARAQDQTSRAKAEQLWEQAIEAKGGRDRLHSITNVHMSEKGGFLCCWGFGYREYVYEGLMVFPSKSWEWDDQRGTVFGFTIDLHNFDKNIHQSLNKAGSIVPIMKPSATSLTRLQLHIMMESKWVRPIPVGERIDKHDGREVDIVETRVAGLAWYDDKVEFVLDRKTHLPREVVYHWTTRDGRHLSGGVRLSKYISISGLRVPSHIGRQKFRYEFNVEYDERIFENAPDATLGMYAWKKKK